MLSLVCHTLSFWPTFLLVPSPRKVMHGTTVLGIPFSVGKFSQTRRTYHSAIVWGNPFLFCKFSCTRHTYHSATVWGNPFCSVNFCARDIRTIQQRCGAGHFCSVNFRERDARTISRLYWGSLRLAPNISSTFSKAHSPPNHCCQGTIVRKISGQLCKITV